MPPLGYDARDRKLQINAAEAAVVRHIFERYLALGSTRALAEELEREGYRSKAWETRAGRALGGRVLSRGAVIHILQSRVYVGEIVHRDKVHPGLHEPIIVRDMFDAVQAKMRSLARAHQERPVRAQPGVLLGKLFDANGEPMGPTFAYGKQKQLYRYYMPVSWQTRRKGQRGDGVQERISADALEGFLVSALQRFTGRTTIAIADLAVLLTVSRCRRICRSSASAKSDGSSQGPSVGSGNSTTGLGLRPGFDRGSWSSAGWAAGAGTRRGLRDLDPPWTRRRLTARSRTIRIGRRSCRAATTRSTSRPASRAISAQAQLSPSAGAGVRRSCSRSRYARTRARSPGGRARESRVRQ